MMNLPPNLPQKDHGPVVLKLVLFIVLAVGSTVFMNPIPVLLFGYLAYRQYKTFRLIGYFNQYLQLMSRQGVTSVPVLAQRMGQTPQYVSTQLNAMVRQGFLPPITIDRNTGEIMFPGRGAGGHGHAGAIEMEAYTCTACKASCQKPKGQLVCDYCGSALTRREEAPPW